MTMCNIGIIIGVLMIGLYFYLSVEDIIYDSIGPLGMLGFMFFIWSSMFSFAERKVAVTYEYEYLVSGKPQEVCMVMSVNEDCNVYYGSFSDNEYKFVVENADGTFEEIKSSSSLVKFLPLPESEEPYIEKYIPKVMKRGILDDNDLQYVIKPFWREMGVREVSYEEDEKREYEMIYAYISENSIKLVF